MSASLMYFAMGVVYVSWGFWGQLAEASPDPSAYGRFKWAMFWGALSLCIYCLQRPKKEATLPQRPVPVLND
jgi:hypothetical protein